LRLGQLRPKPPFTEDTAYTALAYTTGALFHGFALHHTVNPGLNHTVYAGADGQWTLPALSFLAILDMVSEAPDQCREPDSARDVSIWGTPQPHSFGRRRIPCVWGPDPPTDTVRADGLDMAGQVVWYASEQRRAALKP